jgi:hypothetical protein
MRRSFFTRWSAAIMVGGIFACFMVTGLLGLSMAWTHALLAVFGVVLGHFALRERRSGYPQLWRGLLERLGKRTAIVGVVSAGGAKVWSFNHEPTQVSFAFSAWRRPDGKLQRRGRGFNLPSTFFTAGRHTKKLQPYSVVEIQLLGDPEAVPGKVAKVLRTNVQDPELEAISIQLQKPVTIELQGAGTLRLDRADDVFVCDIDWGARKVELRLNCDDNEKPRKVLGMAEALLRDKKLWQERADRFAVEQLLEGARDWAAAGEPELTAEILLARLELKTIDLDESGDISFLYEDGGLYGGHYVSISGSVSTGFDDSQLLG